MKERTADLSVFPRDPVKDGSEGAVGITGFFSRLRIVLVSLRQSLWSKVIRIAEWFVDALKRVPAGHEDLEL
jgi:hypothetical protein